MFNFIQKFKGNGSRFQKVTVAFVVGAVVGGISYSLGAPQMITNAPVIGTAAGISFAL